MLNTYSSVVFKFNTQSNVLYLLSLQAKFNGMYWVMVCKPKY